MGNVYGKMILMLGWSGLVFYDEDDNFRDKDWILTSYDNSRKEDKIRKSSTILNRPDSSNDTDSARRNSLISSGALSLPKDISYLLNEQQLMDEIIEKAKQGSPVGREKMLESDVLDFDDLKEGMELKGTVRNVIDFGAFVDIGVHQDGLVHISEMSNKFIKHPLDVVSVGDVVDVRVLSVDKERKRIQLSMKK